MRHGVGIGCPRVADVGLGALGALTALGWGERVQPMVDVDGAGVPGRVVRVERSRSIVIGTDGRECLVTSSGLLAVGDWVMFDDGVVLDVLPRWSAVERKDPSGAGNQVLAANVDVVLITAPADRFSAARLERELAIGWDSGAQPLVVLTKADVAGKTVLGELRERLVGVEVVPASVRTGEGVDVILATLRPDRTAVLLGPSGAGKSSLANALVGTDLLATGAVRDGDSRGRHTTTSRQLIGVPGGGVLIDTPGLRSLGLAGEGSIEQVFPEIEELAAACRFDDCRHEVEPGCAVMAAGTAGTIDPARLANYRKLQAEIAADVRRRDPLVRKAELTTSKAQVKAAKAKAKSRRRS